jgi:hypothetical protein
MPNAHANPGLQFLSCIETIPPGCPDRASEAPTSACDTTGDISFARKLYRAIYRRKPFKFFSRDSACNAGETSVSPSPLSLDIAHRVLPLSSGLTNNSTEGRMRFRTIALISTLALAAASCGGSDSSTGPTTGPSGTFRGTLVGSNSRGVIVIVFATQGATAITGTLALTGGATINLSGTYTGSSKHASLTGGGYTVTGDYTESSSHFAGDYTGPNTDHGSWAVESGTVKVFCGTYTGSATGTWNLVLNDAGQLRGVAQTTSGAIDLVGTYNSSSGAITVTSPDDATVGASGTLNATTGGGSGHWTISGQTAGDWTANTNGC